MIRLPLFLSLMLISALSAATAQPTVHYVGIDISSSTKMASDQRFAARSASFVEDRLRQNILTGDLVELEWIGAASMTSRVRITQKVRPGWSGSKAATEIAEMIRNTPLFIEAGRLIPAQQTDLVGLLRATDDRLKLSHNGAHRQLLLITDGIESTPRRDHGSFLRCVEAGANPLPKVPPSTLADVDVTLIGLGAFSGADDSALAFKIKAAWDRWGGTTSASSFTTLTDF